MASNSKHPLYTLFLALMVLTALCGVALLIWGSVTNGLPLSLLRLTPGGLHG